MERKRVDLSGSGGSAPKPSKKSPGDAVAAEKKKNLILAAVGTLLLIGAVYLIYANFFATPGPVSDITPEQESTFQEAAQHQPPPQDSEPLPEPGSGKRPN